MKIELRNEGKDLDHPWMWDQISQGRGKEKVLGLLYRGDTQIHREVWTKSKEGNKGIFPHVGIGEKGKESGDCNIVEICRSDLYSLVWKDPIEMGMERGISPKENFLTQRNRKEDSGNFFGRGYGNLRAYRGYDESQKILGGESVVFKKRQREFMNSSFYSFFLVFIKSSLSPYFSTMAQIMTQAMARAQAAKGKTSVVRTATLRLQDTDMEEKMKKFERTLIGRLMNPEVQRIDLLIENFPKIWKMQDKVVGTDLGAGRFQFDFKTEEDIAKVLFQAPYHFDGFMVSLVSWEPSFAPNYPSAITFWVKLLDVPTHILSEAILHLVGHVIGEVVCTDVPTGSVLVKVDGYSSLLFQVIVPLDSGIELNVGLEYDRLIGFCGKCYKLIHDENKCPKEEEDTEEVAKVTRETKGKGTYAEVAAQVAEPSWEMQKRTSAKRTLDFEEERHVFPYKKIGKGRQSDNQRDEPQRDREDIYRGNKQSRGRDTYHGYRPGSQGRGNRGAGSNWPLPLYQAKVTVNRTGGERVAEKSDLREVIGSTPTVEVAPNKDNIEDGHQKVQTGDKVLGEDEAHSAENRDLLTSPTRATTLEDRNLMEGIEGQGENQIEEMGNDATMEQGKNENPKLGTTSLELEVVSKALRAIVIKASPKKTGLPGRKYNTVVLASPKKRLLLNRIYGSIKSPGKNLKNQKKLVNNGVGDSGKSLGDMGGKSIGGSGKRGQTGGGIPKPTNKK